MRLYGNLDLGAYGVGYQFHQRQVTVRGSTGDDLQMPRFHEASERLDQVVIVAVNEQVACLTQFVEIHLSQRLHFRKIVGALHFFFRQFQRAVEKPEVTPLQQGIAEHGQQRWRQRHGDLEGHTILSSPSNTWIKGI